MNHNHATLCSSAEWTEFLTTEVLDPLVARFELGEDLLELGPGYGAATRWLRHRVKRLTALELDLTLAGRLQDEFAGTNVTVEVGDCTRAPFADGSFDSVASAELHGFHEGDTYNPIDPARLLVFLQAIGYDRINLSVDYGVMFAARKPTEVAGHA